MTTNIALQNLVFTKQNAARILGVKRNRVTLVKPDDFGAWIEVDGWEIHFASKQQFYKMFVDDRRSRANGLSVTQNAFNPTMFTVRNDDNGNRYDVEATPNSIVCICGDYVQQNEAGLNGCCKHGYAVLNLMGYGSLSDYREEQIEVLVFERQKQVERDYYHG